MATTRSYGDHILRRGNVYYFRQVIPNDLRERVGRSEIRISLRTAYLREARTKAKAMAGVGVWVFNQIRQDSSMDKREIDRIIKEQFHKFLGECEDKMLASGPTTLHEVMKSLSKFDKIKQGIQWNLVTRDFGWVGKNARTVAEHHGLDTDEDSLEYRKLAFEMLRAYKDVVEILQHRLQGDFDHEVSIMEKYKLDAAPVPAPVSPQATQKSNGITFFELVDRFCKFKITMKRWTGRGIKEQPKKFDIIKLILGDIPVSEINADTAMYVLECLQKLPPRLDAKRYDGKSAEEIMSMTHKKRLAVKTINLRMDLMAGLFKYAVKNDFAVKNYFSELQLTDPEKAYEKRAVFTVDDLKTIFDPATFLPYCGDDETRYWMPVLALYSGARIEELAQLEVDDVYVEDDILVLDINDAGNKHLKTKSSKRKAPVYEIVRKELGFEAYVERVKSAGEKHIFPNLNRVNTRRGHKPSRDFNRHVQRLGIEGKKSFHSFRHTFIDFLRNNGVRNGHISGVTGHRDYDDKAISDNYKKQFGLRFLVDEVMVHVGYGSVVIPRFDRA